MKNLTINILLLCIVGCASTQNAANKEECGIDQLLSGISCIEPNIEEIENNPLGSAGNPVRADGPEGQREYLSRLVCTNGQPVSDFRRLGSTGIGPWGFMLDAYIVLCDTNEGVEEHTVYMDMYHKGYNEVNVAQGFGSVKM